MRSLFPGRPAGLRRGMRLGVRLGVGAACAAGWLAAAGDVRGAVTMTASSAPPAVDALDQANFADDATIPGQTFKTPAGDPVTLRSISLKGANTGTGNSGGNVFAAGTTWSVRLSTPNGPALSPHHVWSGIPTVTGAQGNEWFTFTFTGNDA